MKLERGIVILILALAGLAGFVVSYWQNVARENRSAKAPMQTNFVGLSDVPLAEKAHYPLSFVRGLKNDGQTGRKIFKAYCGFCHVEQAEIPVGAPRMGYPADWDAWQHWTSAQFLVAVAQGQGAMPARGGCFECSDAQLQQAIVYILEKNKQQKMKTQDAKK